MITSEKEFVTMEKNSKKAFKAETAAKKGKKMLKVMKSI